MVLREALRRLAEADRIVLDVSGDYHAWEAQEIVDGVAGWNEEEMGAAYYDQEVYVGHCLFDTRNERILPDQALSWPKPEEAVRVQCIRQRDYTWLPLFIIPDRTTEWDVIVDRAEKAFHKHVEHIEGVWAVNLYTLREELEIFVEQVMGTKHPGPVVTLVFDHFGFFETTPAVPRWLRSHWRGLQFAD